MEATASGTTRFPRAIDAEIREEDGSDFAVLRAHLHLLSIGLQRGERVADREERLLADDELVEEVAALLEYADRLRRQVKEIQRVLETPPPPPRKRRR